MHSQGMTRNRGNSCEVLYALGLPVVSRNERGNMVLLL
jgi:hypothetical protein